MPPATKKPRTTRRSRRKRGIDVVQLDAQIDTTTLADGIILKLAPSGAFTRDFFALSADIWWTLREGTAMEGPLMVGLVHNDYTVAEIKEFLDLEQLGTQDRIAVERASRLVRRAGSFSGLETDEALNNGNPIRTTLKFLVQEGMFVAGYVHNKSGAALSNGPTIQMNGQMYGRWQKS